MFSEILKEFFSLKKGQIGIELYTENKSLYDALCTSYKLSEKRFRFDIAVLWEFNDNVKVRFRCFDSKNQLADLLTKNGTLTLKMLVLLRCAHLDA